LFRRVWAAGQVVSAKSSPALAHPRQLTEDRATALPLIPDNSSWNSINQGVNMYLRNMSGLPILEVGVLEVGGAILGFRLWDSLDYIQ